MAQNRPPGQYFDAQQWISSLPPDPPRKRRRTGLWITLGVLAALLLCGGGITGAIVTVRGISDAIQPVTSAATQYLNAIQEADYPHAYELLCRSVRSEITVQDLQASEPKIDHYVIKSTSVNDTNGVMRATVVADVTIQAATVTRVFTLVKESGAWRVCRA